MDLANEQEARMARHDLTDAQWDCIATLFPKPAATGRPSADWRQVMDAILWIVRTGAPWRDLPAEFGPWQTVYHHFNRWSSDGRLDKILSHLKRAMSDSESFDHELWCVDGTVVRAARCAAGGGKKTTRANLAIMR
jgi:transposase